MSKTAKRKEPAVGNRPDRSAPVTAADVITGTATWSCEAADAVAWLRGLPDDSVDLLVTSPPYELARTYGIADRMVGGEAWVAWMVEVVKAASPKVKGLIAVVCEGQTRRYRYSCVPFLLMADLHRAGFNLRKPPVFHRVGIPGSGGPDWLRNDWEPIVCVTRPGKLPWSDNTACGHPPKWAPGGEMSNRLSDGTRVNQWGKCGTEGGVNGKRQPAKRPSHKMTTKNAHGVYTGKPVGTRPYGDKGKNDNGRERYRSGTATKGHKNGDSQTVSGGYNPPVLANPGNVIKCGLSFEEWQIMITTYGNATKTRPAEVLRGLRHAVSSGTLPVWLFGISTSVLGAEILQSELHGIGGENLRANHLQGLPDVVQAEKCSDPVLQSDLSGRSESDEASGLEGCGQRSSHSPQEDGQDGMREMPKAGPPPRPSSRRKPDQQPVGQPPSPVLVVPSQGACEAASDMSNLWAVGEEVQGLWAIVRQALPSLQEVWRSTPFSSYRRAILPRLESPDVIRCIVGGGVMGHELAALNEAPYPLTLAEFFVRSFSPPNGIVCDPFSGSGTTAHAAILHGRRFVGCDLRESQVELTERRLKTVTPDLFVSGGLS